MGSKFLLIIALSKSLTTEDYGVLSMVLTTLTFLMFFLGLDFYNFSHREIIENDSLKVKFLVNQFWFHLICYVVYIPIIYIIFINDIIPLSYIIPFYLLLVLEHFGQELFRFFNLFNKPNQANLILLIRTGLWIAIMVIVEYFILERPITIEHVLYYWIAGSFLAVLYSLIYVFIIGSTDFKTINWFSIDKKWIKTGIRISLPFFFGTIAYKIIEYSDRYMIDWFLDKSAVGIYSFYANFANIINIIVSTITITLIVPNLLRAISAKEPIEIEKQISKFFKELWVTTLGVSVIVVFLIFPVLSWQDKPEFKAEIVVYFVILIANIAFNMSLFYHFLLYAYKKDNSILKPTIYASLANIVLNLIFIPKFGLIAAALSTLLSFLLILILKRKYWLDFNSKDIE
ncbi:oligosaccharide flippase family protein [Psychroserpens burtonensis]|nr:oligosaccharide flippase family protein [Psychroserpens burtonensis]